MKNNQTNLDLSTLAAQGTRLDFAIAEARGLVTVTRLAPKKATKALLGANRVGGSGTRWSPAARGPADGGGRIKAGAARVR